MKFLWIVNYYRIKRKLSEISISPKKHFCPFLKFEQIYSARRRTPPRSAKTTAPIIPIVVPKEPVGAIVGIGVAVTTVPPEELVVGVGAFVGVEVTPDPEAVIVFEQLCEIAPLLSVKVTEELNVPPTLYV